MCDMWIEDDGTILADFAKPRSIRRAEWIKTLLARKSFTAEEAGKAAGCYGPDAITRLRSCRTLKVEIVGTTGRRKIYRVQESA